MSVCLFFIGLVNLYCSTLLLPKYVKDVDLSNVLNCSGSIVEGLLNEFVVINSPCSGACGKVCCACLHLLLCCVFF